jgi:hypothetical protein
MATTKTPAELAVERRYPGKSSTDIEKDLRAEDVNKEVRRLNERDAASAAEKERAMKEAAPRPENEQTASNMKKGGKVHKMAKGGSASSRADGCCTKGKTKGQML